MAEPDDDSKWSVVTSYSLNPFAALPADFREALWEFLRMTHKRWMSQ